jgi:hypothetical protein
VSLMFCGAKSGISEIVTLAQNAFACSLHQCFRSLQVPMSGTTQAHAKGVYLHKNNLLHTLSFNATVGYLIKIILILPFCYNSIQIFFVIYLI